MAMGVVGDWLAERVAGAVGMASCEGCKEDEEEGAGVALVETWSADEEGEMAGGDGIFKEGADGETSGGLAEVVAVDLEEAMIEREAEPEEKRG